MAFKKSTEICGTCKVDFFPPPPCPATLRNQVVPRKSYVPGLHSRADQLSELIVERILLHNLKRRRLLTFLIVELSSLHQSF